MVVTAAKQRIGLATAERIAEDLKALLSPACERIEVAGSIRRRQPYVGDIELVAAPQMVAGLTVDLGLFDEVQQVTINALHEECGRLRQNGELADRLDKNGRPAWGAKFKRASFRGIAVDIFAVVRPAQWGVLYAIRTGPADYVHQLVTHRGDTFRDSQGARRWGLLPTDLTVRDGQLFEVNEPEQFRAVETPEERDFFAAIDVPYVEPWERR